jgi:hypothetical protein
MSGTVTSLPLHAFMACTGTLLFFKYVHMDTCRHLKPYYESTWSKWRPKRRYRGCSSYAEAKQMAAYRSLPVTTDMVEDWIQKQLRY